MVKVSKVASASSVVVPIKAAAGARMVSLPAKRASRRPSVAGRACIKGRRKRFPAAQPRAARVTPPPPKPRLLAGLRAAALNALKLAAAVLPRVRA